MRNKNYAFTLLELLIVIVIIGILASLAIPNFIKTTEAAKGKEAVVNLETIRTAESMYYLDKNRHSSSVVTGAYFTELAPNYLPQDPNGNPSRNWNYGFGNNPSYFWAVRSGGTYNGYVITLNYDTDALGQWPYPP